MQRGGRIPRLDADLSGISAVEGHPIEKRCRGRVHEKSLVLFVHLYDHDGQAVATLDWNISFRFFTLRRRSRAAEGPGYCQDHNQLLPVGPHLPCYPAFTTLSS